MVPIYQSRAHVGEDALQELAESVKLQGIMQPILLRRFNASSAAANSAEYEVIVSERGYRAAKLAGLGTVSMLVRDVPNEAAAVMSIIESIQLRPQRTGGGAMAAAPHCRVRHDPRNCRARCWSLTQRHQQPVAPAQPGRASPGHAMLMAGDINMGNTRAMLALEQGMQITAVNQIAGELADEA
jgi:ParB family chromosome partitioning protein